MPRSEEIRRFFVAPQPARRYAFLRRKCHDQFTLPEIGQRGNSWDIYAAGSDSWDIPRLGGDTDKVYYISGTASPGAHGSVLVKLEDLTTSAVIFTNYGDGGSFSSTPLPPEGSPLSDGHTYQLSYNVSDTLQGSNGVSTDNASLQDFGFAAFTPAPEPAFLAALAAVALVLRRNRRRI